MQKLYNQIETSSQTKTGCTEESLVLEYDDQTKKPVVQVHPLLVKLLKPHQMSGIKFMYTSTVESIKRLEEDAGSGCVLAHSMGLGKTLQVIAFVHTLLVHETISDTIGRVLVVCPKNTCRNWASEFQMWLFDNDLSDFIVEDFDTFKTATERQKALRRWQKEGGVMIIGDSLMSRLVLEATPDLQKTKSGTKAKKSRNSESFNKTIRECLCDPGGDIVIVDEGHKIKNDTSQLNRALNTVRTHRRIILTGTPLQNNLNEYHVMVDFVKPSLLGTKKEFLNRFINPITRGQHEDSTGYDVSVMKKRTHVLHKLLEGCVQRQDYRILAPYLQPKHEYVLKVKLTDVQQKIYQHYLDHFSGKKNIGQKGAAKGYLFNDCSVFRLICTHPMLLQKVEERKMERQLEKDFVNDKSDSSTPEEDSDIEELEKNAVTPTPNASKRKTRSMKGDLNPDSPQLPKEPDWFKQYMPDLDEEKSEVKDTVSIGGKMALFFQILEMCEKIGDKLIVFSQSLDVLNMIECFLGQINSVNYFKKRQPGDLLDTWALGHDYFRIDGASSSDSRKKDINKFNDTKNRRARLFLLSTKAGCLGINLVGANRCIIFDASWNPTHDVQAIFRIYRFGQDKPIYVYRFVSFGTMEERVYDRQIIKQALACRVVDEQQIDRHFKANELLELYRFQPEPEEAQIPLVPKDKLLADILSNEVTKKLIVNYHEHDSLLEERPEENLTEEERKSAWEEFEKEKETRAPPPSAFDNQFNFVPQLGMSNYSHSNGMNHEEWFTYIEQQLAQQRQQPLTTQRPAAQPPKTVQEMTFQSLYALFSEHLTTPVHKPTDERIIEEMISYVEKNRVKVSAELTEIYAQEQNASTLAMIEARRKDMNHLQFLRTAIVAKLEFLRQQRKLAEERILLQQQQQQEHHFFAQQRRLLQEQLEAKERAQTLSFTDMLD